MRWLGAAVLWLALSSVASADDQEHRASLAAGLPIPFEAYGGDASLAEAGVELTFILHARASYVANPFASMPAFVIGARSSVSTATVTDGELSLWGWVALAGPHVGVRLSPAVLPGALVVVAGGPALARSGFRIDAALHREFWAGAWFGFVQLSVPAFGPLHVTFDAALEHVLPAPENETFFNQRLGSTTLLALAAGVELAL